MEKKAFGSLLRGATNMVSRHADDAGKMLANKQLAKTMMPRGQAFDDALLQSLGPQGIRNAQPVSNVRSAFDAANMRYPAPASGSVSDLVASATGGGGNRRLVNRNMINQMRRQSRAASDAAVADYGPNKLNWRDMEMYSPASGEALGAAQGYARNALREAAEASALPRGHADRKFAADFLKQVRGYKGAHPRSYHAPIGRNGLPAAPNTPAAASGSWRNAPTAAPQGSVTNLKDSEWEEILAGNNRSAAMPAAATPPPIPAAAATPPPIPKAAPSVVTPPPMPTNSPSGRGMAGSVLGGLGAGYLGAEYL